MLFLNANTLIIAPPPLLKDWLRKLPMTKPFGLQPVKLVEQRQDFYSIYISIYHSHTCAFYSCFM